MCSLRGGWFYQLNKVLKKTYSMEEEKKACVIHEKQGEKKNKFANESRK